MNTSYSSSTDTPDNAEKRATVDAGTERLLALVDLLQKIDSTGPLAKLNETSISDNNGGRIEL
jgi:hypothetical protein